MHKILVLCLLFSNSLYAGTAGISDISILFATVLIILFAMLGTDVLTKYLKRRKQRLEEQHFLSETKNG